MSAHTRKFEGLIITSHKTIDESSKDRATKTLKGWQRTEKTAAEWFAALEAGHTIILGSFSAKEDGTYTHKEEFWIETHWIFADADNIKGVEKLTTGKEKNPEGVEPWTEQGGLSKQYPSLKDNAYAVGQSVSSMAEWRQPLHRRYRIAFQFDKAIRDGKQYRHVLLKLSKKYPIICAVERQPAQPVFGNAREEFSKYSMCGNILKLDDYLSDFQPEPAKSQPNLFNQLPSETLEEFLRRHGISYSPTDTLNKFYVECPYSSGHTGGKQGSTDSYVFDDGTGWAFYCSHASCKGHRTWEAFKSGVGIETKPPFSKTTPTHILKNETLSDDDIEQSDEDPKMVEFPEEVFFGIFKTYRDSFEGRTPLPDAFAFATLKHLIAASLGRRIHLESQVPIYPNIYTGLVGESGEGHKGVSLSIAKKLIQQADPNVFVLSKISTEEGLINLFVKPRETTKEDDDGEEYIFYQGGFAELIPQDFAAKIIENMDSHESIRLLASFEEFSGLLNRSRKLNFSGIPELCMELYDSPQYISVPNRNEATFAEYPTFSLIGGSAFELIEQSLGQHYITAGFTNRIEWYLGEEKEAMFLYKHAEIDAWNECVNVVSEIRDTYQPGQHFELADGAYNFGDTWNKEFVKIHKSIDNMLVSGSLKRIKMFVIKNSLIFAALEARGDFKIHEEDIRKAVKLAEYNCTVVEKLFGSFASTEHQRVCNRVVEILKANPLMSAKQVANKMIWADIKEIDLAIELMVKMGILGVSQPKRTNLYFVTSDKVQ